MIRAIPRVYIDVNVMELLSDIANLIRFGQIPESDKIFQFEKAFSDYIGTENARAFSSCRAAIYFSLKALDLEPGSEVILPAFSFWIDTAMVKMAGLKPVFVDVNFETAVIDSKKIESEITERTKVIFPCHLNGIPADMEAIYNIAKRHNLRVIEDCARSCGVQINGKQTGSMDIGVFSFGYGKNLYLFGGGGMVTSNDSDFIYRLDHYRKEFQRLSVKDKFVKTLKGSILKFVNMPFLFRFLLFPLLYEHQIRKNTKLSKLLEPKEPPYDEVPSQFKVQMNYIQARQGIRALKKIDKSNLKQWENARILRNKLSKLPGLYLFSVPNTTKEMLYFSFWSERKEELKRYLMDRRIEITDESASDITRHSKFMSNDMGGSFPNSRKLNKKVFFIPCHSNLLRKDIDYIVKKIHEFFLVHPDNSQ